MFERNLKVLFSFCLVTFLMFGFQNCTEFEGQLAEDNSADIINLDSKSGSQKLIDEENVIIEDSPVYLSNNPMSLFVNCGTHYESSKENITDLNPGFIRVFVNDWKRQVAIDRAYKCMEELETDKRIFLLQFTKIYEDDDLSQFENVLHYFNDRFGSKIKYWQIGNEYDHDNSQNYPVGLSEFAGFVGRLNHIRSFLSENNPTAKLALSLTSKTFDPEKPERLEKFLGLRRAITQNYSGNDLTIDMHYHHEFEDASKIIVPMNRLFNRFQSYNTEIIITENNTHTGTANRRNNDGEIIKELSTQSEEMQASYGLRTVSLALSGGAKYTTFGYPIDRPNFGNPLWVDHHFALNGLFYNEEKEYSDGKKSGPKRSAYAYWLLSSLFERQFSDFSTSRYIVSSERKGKTGLQIVSFTPEAEGKGFKLIWFDKYEDDNEIKTYKLNINHETHAVFNASKVGHRIGWPPLSLDEFINSFDITNRRDSFKNLRVKRSDTFIVIDR